MGYQNTPPEYLLSYAFFDRNMSQAAIHECIKADNSISSAVKGLLHMSQILLDPILSPAN